MVYNDMESRRQASEAIKNLVVNEKRSKLPLILGTLIVLGLLGAGGYWYMLPPAQRPDLDQIKNRVMSSVDGILNAPIAKPAQAPQGTSAANSKSPASSSSENTGLLSN
jgi:hypothetical protein